MKLPYSFGKGNSEDYTPLNGEHLFHMEAMTPTQAHDKTIARIQYMYDYLYEQQHQLTSEDPDSHEMLLLARILATYYEVFQDIIYGVELDEPGHD